MGLDAKRYECLIYKIGKIASQKGFFENYEIVYALFDLTIW